MHNLDGIDVARRYRSGAFSRPRSADRGGDRRLEWVLCVAFDDAGAVEDAFEDAYSALTDAGNQTAQQFEAASSDLEKAYDAWLAAALALAEGAPGRSPEWGKPSRGLGKLALPLPATERKDCRMTTSRTNETSAATERRDLDGTPYEGAATDRAADPPPLAGLHKRPQRVAEWTHLKSVEIKRRPGAAPELSDGEMQAEAERALHALYKRPYAAPILDQLERRRRRRAHRALLHREEAEIAAARWLGPIRWLIERLTTRMGSRGPLPCRAMVVAVFLQMAFSRVRPTISATHKNLKAGHPILSWAHDYRRWARATPALCEALDDMLHHHPRPRPWSTSTSS